MDKTKCYRCENKSYTYCKDCVDNSNFKASCTYEEYKKWRKEQNRRDKLGSRNS